MKKLLILLFLLTGIAASQQPTLINTQILYVDSTQYPRLDAYVSIIDREQLTPINNLSADNFFVDTDTGEPLTLESISQERRPLHIMVVLDRTGSVSAMELINQAAAVQVLINRLQPDDQIGLIVTDDTSAEMASPLQSDTTNLINSLQTLNPLEDATGNVYWDGVHAALTVLAASPESVRRVVIVMTDISPQGGEGSHTEVESIRLAVDNKIAVYGLYFEYEGDGIPNNPPVLPPELTVITETTGGVASGTAAELRAGSSEQDYTDDDALPAMMNTLADLLTSEYHLMMSAPLPANGQEAGLNVTITINGNILPPLRGSFTAGISPVKIDFPDLTNQQEITLPFMVNITAESSEGSITTINAYAVNETGQRTPLDAIESQQLTLEPGDIQPGLFRLLIEAQDSAGNTGQRDIFLSVIEKLSVTLVDIPETIDANQSLIVTARVGLPASVTSAAFIVDGAEQETRTLGPFDEINFTWLPTKSGEHRIEIRVDDVLGNSANQQATIRVNPGAESGGGLSTALVIVVGVVAVIFGAGLMMLRRRTPRTMVEASPAIEGYEAPTSEKIPPPVVVKKSTTPVAELRGTAGEHWMLYEGENTLGRHGSNHIQIRDESVSRYHAKIIVVGKRCFLQDWQASHPSEINGVLLESEKRYELKSGDRLRIGSSLLEFEKLG